MVALSAIQTCEFTANTLMNFIGNAVLSSGSWQGAVLAGGVSQHLKDIPWSGISVRKI